jgi:hypothetical protein
MTLCITSLAAFERFTMFLECLCLDDGAHLWAEDVADAAWHHQEFVLWTRKHVFAGGATPFRTKTGTRRSTLPCP